MDICTVKLMVEIMLHFIGMIVTRKTTLATKALGRTKTITNKMFSSLQTSSSISPTRASLAVRLPRKQINFHSVPV